MATTPLQGLPYPVGSDSPAGHTQILALANAVEKKSVMVFASDAARTTALTAASVTPAEGMLCWLQDTNTYQYYNGSAWVPIPFGKTVRYYATSAAGDTTFATSYTTKTGAVTPSLTKHGSATATNLEVQVALTGFYQSLFSRGTFAVQVGGTDFEVCLFNPGANSVRIFTGGVVLCTGLAAGSYTAQLRGKSVVGTAVFRMTSGDDFINITMREVDA